MKPFALFNVFHILTRVCLVELGGRRTYSPADTISLLCTLEGGLLSRGSYAVRMAFSILSVCLANPICIDDAKN
jgi:hypothetical protein